MGSAIAYGFGNSLKLKLRNYIHSPEKYIKENEKKFYALDIFEPEEFILPISIFSLIFSITLALTIYLAWQYLSENPMLHNNPVFYALAEIPPDIKNPLKAGTCLILALILYPHLSRATLNIILYFKTNEKREKIDQNLFSALCILGGLGRGGVPIQQAIEELANSDLEGVREEFAKIHTALKYVGVELKEAILTVAMTTVSEKLSIFLRGLVNYIEKRKDYSDYVTEYLTIDNLNRRVELENYATKLKNLSAVFIALLTIMPTIGIFAITSSLIEAGGEDLAIVTIYIGTPFTAVGMLATFYMGSPEKKMRKKMAKEAMIIAFLTGFGVVLSVYIERFLEIPEVIPTALMIALTEASIAHIFFRRYVKREKKVEEELDSFIMDLMAASKTGAPLLSASGEIGKEIAPALAESQVAPLGEALKKQAKKTFHPFLSLVPVHSGLCHPLHQKPGEHARRSSLRLPQVL
jgi:Flp pilus assembly protein TadB